MVYSSLMLSHPTTGPCLVVYPCMRSIHASHLCVRACVRACMCACVHACVRACVRACVSTLLVCVRVCAGGEEGSCTPVSSHILVIPTESHDAMFSYNILIFTSRNARVPVSREYGTSGVQRVEVWKLAVFNEERVPAIIRRKSACHNPE